MFMSNFAGLKVLSFAHCSAAQTSYTIGTGGGDGWEAKEGAWPFANSSTPTSRKTSAQTTVKSALLSYTYCLGFFIQLSCMIRSSLRLSSPGKISTMRTMLDSGVLTIQPGRGRLVSITVADTSAVQCTHPPARLWHAATQQRGGRSRTGQKRVSADPSPGGGGSSAAADGGA
jgi:hypothetical protein